MFAGISACPDSAILARRYLRMALPISLHFMYTQPLKMDFEVAMHSAGRKSKSVNRKSIE